MQARGRKQSRAGHRRALAANQSAIFKRTRSFSVLGVCRSHLLCSFPLLKFAHEGTRNDTEKKSHGIDLQEESYAIIAHAWRFTKIRAGFSRTRYHECWRLSSKFEDPLRFKTTANSAVSRAYIVQTFAADLRLL